MTHNRDWNSTRTRWQSLLCGLSLVAVWVSALSAQSVAPLVPASDSERYLEDVKALTAPQMEGRGDGTKGLGRAARFIEQQYKSLGLEPAGTDSYFQPFSVI